MNGGDDRDVRFAGARVTLRGCRDVNQDRSLFLSSPETIVLCVADGLGGHPRGEVAAQMLADATEARFRQCRKPLVDPERFMLQCIGQAHDAILRFGSRQVPPIAPRTTAVIAIIQHGIAYWAHVGDSRFYLVRNGEVVAQTRDHSQVRFIRQSAEAMPRAFASLTRCLGGLPRPPTTTCGVPTPLARGDGMLLCTDGLWNQVDSQAIAGLFTRGSNLQDGLAGLADAAADAPNSDNVTAIALQWLVDDALSPSLADIPEPPADPVLEQAIDHLEQILKNRS